MDNVNQKASPLSRHLPRRLTRSAVGGKYDSRAESQKSAYREIPASAIGRGSVVPRAISIAQPASRNRLIVPVSLVFFDRALTLAPWPARSQSVARANSPTISRRRLGGRAVSMSLTLNVFAPKAALDVRGLGR